VTKVLGTSDVYVLHEFDADASECRAVTEICRKLMLHGLDALSRRHPTSTLQPRRRTIDGGNWF
jgi:hypothetical protein